jgi:hypothetical protein
MFHQTPNYLSALPIPNAEIARIIGEEPLTLGIDKITLGFAVPPSPSDDLWKEVTEEHHKKKVTRTAPEPFRNGTLYIRHTDTSEWKPDSPCWGSIEFNPSSVAGIQPWLATWEQAMLMLPEALRIAGTYFQMTPLAGNIKVTRLDLALDFEPSLDMQEFLENAASFEPIRGRKPMVYRDPVTRRVESVTFKGREAPSITFYDKSKESNNGHNRLRVEVRVQRRELKKFGLDSLDATEQMRSDAFRARLTPLVDRWRYFAPGFVQRLLASKSDTRTLVMCAGYEALAQIGIRPNISRYMRSMIRKFRKKYPYATIRDLRSDFVTTFVMKDVHTKLIIQLS